MLIRSFCATVVNFDEAGESRRVNARVEALSVLSEPHQVFWSDKSKTSVLVQFQDRVEQVHMFFRKCRDNLAMIYRTMLPLNPQPRSLPELLERFKTPAEVQQLVRNQLVAGAEVAFAFVQSSYPTLDLRIIASKEVPLRHYCPLVAYPAATVVRKLEEGTEAELQLAQSRQQS